MYLYTPDEVDRERAHHQAVIQGADDRDVKRIGNLGELAFEQFKLGGQWQASPVVENSERIEVTEKGETVELSGGDWRIRFDIGQSTIASWTIGGRELVERGPVPDFWRAPTDNDRGAGLRTAGLPQLGRRGALAASMIWEQAGKGWNPADPRVESHSDGSVEVVFGGDILDGQAMVFVGYTVFPGGTVKVEYDYETGEDLPLLLRVGTEWVLPDRFDRFAWYGRGPDSTYSDRRWEPVGVFESTPMDNWVDYSKPQENGNKVDVRWMKIHDEGGFGLQILAENSLSCNVQAFSKADIQSSAYSWQLPQPESVYVNIDFAQMGVGGDNSWGYICHPQYQLDDQAYSFSYFVAPLVPEY